MSSAIEVIKDKGQEMINTNPIIKAHLDSYCFYLENEGRGKAEAREEVSDLVAEICSEFSEALLALEKQQELAKEIKAYITNGWTDKEIKNEWKSYLTTEIKPFFPKLFLVLERVGEQ